ncbi:MAG: hypothetical protein LLF76_02645 [Planctomycetaceae bacterium]|nr:hypothetical protein [Planctomycetaceae bacterium]
MCKGRKIGAQKRILQMYAEYATKFFSDWEKDFAVKILTWPAKTMSTKQSTILTELAKKARIAKKFSA